VLYWLIRGIIRFILLVLGLKYEGLHKLPKKGPVIVASNHVSNWDPIIVGVVLNRPVHFMAKAELFNNKLLSWLIKQLNAFPVRRGIADRTAIKHGLDLLRRGEVLGIFPEGGRNKAGDNRKAQNGVAMLALKSGAPVVPVACIGTGKKLPLGWMNQLVLKIGDPITMENFQGEKMNSAQLEKISAEIMVKIEELLM